MYPARFVSNLGKLDHGDVQKTIAAVQKQLIDMATYWGNYMVLQYVGDRALAPGEPGLTFVDDSNDQYLGEHHLDGVPRGVVLLGACRKFGEDWRETFSHEACEMNGDALANLCYEISGDGTIEAAEASDAVQGSGYTIDGIPVANFVIPAAYFDECGSKYDFQGVLSAPHTRTPSGYRLIRPAGGQWTQDEGETVPESKKVAAMHAWSRRARRAKRPARLAKAA